MANASATSAPFLGTLRDWLDAGLEILILIRHPNAGGSKDFELHSSFETLNSRLCTLAPRTSVIAFRDPQLPIRGIASQALADQCLAAIPDGTEFLMWETETTQYGTAAWRHWVAGETHAELVEAILESGGRSVAVGPYPPWLVDGPTVVSVIVPDPDGSVVAAAY
jgi:hypothetical protein